MKNRMTHLIAGLVVLMASYSAFAGGGQIGSAGVESGYLPAFNDHADSPLNCQVQLKDLQSGEVVSTQKSFTKYIDPILANPEDAADSKNFRVSIGYYPNEVDIRILSKNQKERVASSEIGEISQQIIPENHQEPAADGSLLTGIAQGFAPNVEGKKAVFTGQGTTKEYSVAVDCHN